MVFKYNKSFNNTFGVLRQYVTFSESILMNIVRFELRDWHPLFSHSLISK